MDDTAPQSSDDANPKSLKSVMAQLTSGPETTPGLTSKGKQARTVARLVLVQALYQMELSGIGVEAVIREFADYRFDGDIDSEIEGAQLGVADETFFAEGLRTIVADQGAIDKLIVGRLAANWRLDRLDATLRAILRAGAWELAHRPDVGREVSINEYVEIAKAFYGDTESKFVNAALDGIAGDVR